MEISIKQITSEDLYQIRQIVLRPGLPIESAYFTGDTLQDTYHFGAYINQELCGVVSVFKAKHLELESDNSYQVRGMAVLKDYQNQKIGKHLLEFAEKHLINIGTKLIWMNARESAIYFYEKLNYKIHGNIFDIPGVGLHYVMYKHI